jgi:putative heme-binding domain-containing protein
MLGELAGAAEKLGKIDLPAAWPEVVRRTAGSEDEAVRRQVRTLSVNFGDASVFPMLREVVRDTAAKPELRRESLATLARGDDPQLEALAVGLLDDPQLAADALPLLSRFASADIPRRLLARYEQLPDDLQRIALDTLASRREHAAALLDAIEAGKLARTELSAVHASKIRSLGDAELQERLEELWGVVGGTPEQVARQIEEMTAKYTPQELAKANASRGRLIYNKSCGQCHQLFGEGGDIGPDLTGANRGKLSYLLENILAPSAIVGKDYQAISVLTLDGRVVTGLLREETDAALVLHDAEKLVTIPRSEIDQIGQTTKSVMPEGLLQPMSDGEVADLLKYLQAKSQVLPAVDLPALDRENPRIPDVEEAEARSDVKVSQGSAKPQNMRSFPAGRWSGNQQIWWTGGKPGAQLELPVSVDASGTYEIVAALTKARDYAIVGVQMDDQTLVEGLDLYEPQRVVTTGPVLLGTAQLDAGQHTLTFEIRGANPRAVKAYMVGIDYVMLREATP